MHCVGDASSEETGLLQQAPAIALKTLIRVALPVPGPRET
jgi:hypothetical protein